MPDRLVFDDRLLNRYTVENLESTYPDLHAALGAWFTAFGDFDDASLGKLLGARGPADVDKWKGPAQSALASIPAVVQTLDAVITELERALAARIRLRERRQLEGLLASARANRTTLVEHAPALAAQALGATGTYDAARAEARAAVDRTIARLEAMRVRSEDASRAYRDLQPLVAELREVWTALDRALESLSRQDQRTVRGPHEARMRQAAATLCRNLFDLKMRDRASGIWPPPALPPPGDAVPERFAAALARGDHAAAAALLAPWVAAAWPAQRLAAEVGRRIGETAAGFDLADPPPAGGYAVASNPLRYADLRRGSAGTAVPIEVTAENYGGWFPIEIQTEEEDGYLTDLDTLASLYVIAVSTTDGDRIGHLEFAE